MFYSQFILAKKGPLGTIWIAAHLERKLRKNQVADTDIGVSVATMLTTMSVVGSRSLYKIPWRVWFIVIHSSD